MPAPKTIHTDDRVILLGIALASTELVESISGVYHWDRQWCRRRDRESIEQGWCDYNICKWLCRDDLSESELQSWRREVRRLADEGLIELEHRHVRLTDAGHQRVNEIVAADEGDADE